jgi:probable F420-dependent oxidoreductase
MDLGVVVGGDLTTLADSARQVETAGFESVWVAETARSAFVQAAVVAAATSRIKVGTDIALVFPRSPTITAMSARDLAELSGDRFILGLGTQVKRVNEQRFGISFEHPAPKAAEAVQVIREVLHTFEGAQIQHRGRFYEITMPPFPGAGPVGSVPIYLAAVNAGMAETAGRWADGVLGHPMTSPRYVREVLRPAVDRGAGAGARAGSAVNLTTGAIVQISDDRGLARREAALQIGFYATTRTYRPVLDLHGQGDRIEPLRRAFMQKDFAAMVDIALPMVEDLAVAGTAGECRERIAAFEGSADRIILGGSWVGPDPERLAANHRAIIEAFAPG